jgi:competence protein ComEC
MDFALIKVGHHGSRDAISSQELRDWQCQVALISVGAGNSYGHPTPETLDTLASCNVLTLRTDLDGDLRVIFRGHSFTLEYGERGILFPSL